MVCTCAPNRKCGSERGKGKTGNGSRAADRLPRPSSKATKAEKALAAIIKRIFWSFPAKNGKLCESSLFDPEIEQSPMQSISQEIIGCTLNFVWALLEFDFCQESRKNETLREFLKTLWELSLYERFRLNKQISHGALMMELSDNSHKAPFKIYYGTLKQLC